MKNTINALLVFWTVLALLFPHTSGYAWFVYLGVVLIASVMTINVLFSIQGSFAWNFFYVTKGFLLVLAANVVYAVKSIELLGIQYLIDYISSIIMVIGIMMIFFVYGLFFKRYPFKPEHRKL